MDILQKIKNYFLLKSIEKNRGRKKTKLTTLKHAKSIGILISITSEEEYKRLVKFVHLPEFNHKSTCILGYCDDKTVPHYCLSQLTHDFFCKKQLNWFNKPQSEHIVQFCKKDLDLLIVYTKESIPAFQYILGTSNAKFITGYVPQKTEYLDLSLQFFKIPEFPEVISVMDNYTETLLGQSKPNNENL